MLADLLKALSAEFHLDRIAQRPRNAARLLLAHLGSEVKLCFVPAALFGPLERAGGQLGGDRHEDLVLAQAEVSCLERHRQLDARRLGAHGLFELAFAILGGEDPVVFRRVVTFAVPHAQAGGIHAHFHAPPAAIGLGIRAVETQQVVAPCIGQHLLENFPEIARIEKRAATCIVRQRRQRLARILARLHLVEHRRAGEHGRARGRARVRVAAGNRRQQPAGVYCVKRDVGAVCRIGRGTKLRAVFLARLCDSAGEVNHRLFSRDVAQQVG